MLAATPAAPAAAVAVALLLTTPRLADALAQFAGILWPAAFAAAPAAAVLATHLAEARGLTDIRRDVCGQVGQHVLGDIVARIPRYCLR